MRSASAQVSQAKSDLELAKTRLKRAEAAYQSGDGALAQVQEARAAVKARKAAVRSSRAGLSARKAGVAGAKARLGKATVKAGRTELRAPFDGIVARINVRRGDYVSPSGVDRSSESRQLATAPVTIVDPSEYEAVLEVPAFEARRVKPGQLAAIIDAKAELSAPRGPTDLATLPISLGRVFSVARAVDADSRTAQVRVRTRHKVDLLNHGQFVTRVIVTDERHDVVIATLETLVFRDNQAYAFVVDPGTRKVSRRQLELGLRGTRTYEVTRGLRSGEQVVTTGRFGMTEGAAVEVTRRDTPDIGWQGSPRRHGPPGRVLADVDAAGVGDRLRPAELHRGRLHGDSTAVRSADGRAEPGAWGTPRPGVTQPTVGSLHLLGSRSTGTTFLAHQKATCLLIYNPLL